MSDLAAQWAACHTDLTEVVLSECKFLTDKAAHMLSVLPALRSLRLDGAEALSDQGAAALRTLGPSLTSLDLSNTLVCACRPVLAAGLPDMNCRVAERPLIMACLKKSLSQLQHPLPPVSQSICVLGMLLEHTGIAPVGTLLFGAACFTLPPLYGPP